MFRRSLSPIEVVRNAGEEGPRLEVLDRRDTSALARSDLAKSKEPRAWGGKPGDRGREPGKAEGGAE